jgi:hypothetical protein
MKGIIRWCGLSAFPSQISGHGLSNDLAFSSKATISRRYQEPRAKDTKGIGPKATKACFVDSYRIAILSFVKAGCIVGSNAPASFFCHKIPQLPRYCQLPDSMTPCNQSELPRPQYFLWITIFTGWSNN